MNFTVTSERDVPVQLLLHFTDGTQWPCKIKYSTYNQYPQREWLREDNTYLCGITATGRKAFEVESIEVEYWDAATGEDRSVTISAEFKPDGELADINLPSGCSYWAAKLREKALAEK